MGKTIRGLFLAFFFLSLSLVFVKSQAHAVNTATSPGEIHRDLKSDFRKLATTAALQNKASRASDFATKACEVHTKVIKLRENNIASHAARVEERLGKLTTAVEKFYTDNLVSQGKTVTGYDDLVANVSSKQAALTPLVEKIKTDSENLSCAKGTQRAQFAVFRGDMQNLLKGFKEYRLSVLKLMQAVRKAAGEAEEGEASGSAKENNE